MEKRERERVGHSLTEKFNLQGVQALKYLLISSLTLHYGDQFPWPVNYFRD
jgi:hypothetical protein